MLRSRTLGVRFVAALAVIAAGSLLPQASAVTVFQTNNGNWTVPGNWDNGVPDAGDDGEIPNGFIALGDGLLADTNVTVQNGGTLRVTSANQVVSGDLVTDGFINVEDGGRLEYTINAGTLANHDTVNLFDGASIGRHPGSTAPVSSFAHVDVNIVGTGAEVYFQGVHPGGRYFDIIGSITGDSTTTLVGTNFGTNNGTIAIISDTDNLFAGKTIIRSSNGTTRGVLAVQGENPLGTGAAGVVEVQNLGSFRLRSNTGVTGTGQIQVQSGGRIEIDGNSSGNTIQLMDGSELGRAETSFTTNTSTDTINIDSNATVTFTGMNSSRRLILSGPINADSSTIINVVNNGSLDGYFQINSTTGNAIDGQIIVTGTNDGDRGRLAAGGTNPLGSGLANHVVIGNYGLIEFMTNTGLQSGTDIVEVQSNGRVEFSGISSGNRIQMANNTTIARPSTSPTTAISNDIIEFANNANITLYGSYPSPREYVLQGPLSGSNLNVTMQNEGILDGELRINATTANALSGQMIVKGSSAADLGSLGLQGISPLGTMTVEIQEFGNVLAYAGGLDDQPEVTVLDGGTLRFRAGGSSTWTNSTLRGDGLVRSEAAGGQEQIDNTTQALTLNDVLVSPGTGAGTLTVQATTLTMNAGSTLEIELGSTSDLLAVEGNLDLTDGPTLSLLALDGLSEGDYIIATYSGTLSGEFGDILVNLGPDYGFAGIDYGVLNPGAITLSITAIPEPTTGLMALFGLAGLYIRRRKHRA